MIREFDILSDLGDNTAFRVACDLGTLDYRYVLPCKRRLPHLPVIKAQHVSKPPGPIALASDGSSWNRFMLSHKGHVFQTQEWGQLAAALGWKAHHLVWKDTSGKWLAAATVLERSRLGDAFRMHYIPRGPVMVEPLEEGWEMVANGLADFARSRRALVARLSPYASREDNSGEVFESLGWERAVGREMHVRTFRLGIPKEEKTLWEGLEYRSQKAIKKAQAGGITVTKHGDDDIDSFISLYERTAHRLRISSHRRDFLRAVWHRLAPKGWAHMFMARKNDKALSGLFLLQYGNALEEMWLGWDDAAKEMRPNQLLHWEILRWCLHNGIETYDFGGVPPQADPTRGVYFYKSGFGAKLVNLTGEYDFFPSRWGKLAWTRLRPVMQKFRLEK